MKIGDKVRFLSETGGGRVAGFQGKGIVLVEDADGFEIPFPINDVVVVSDEDYSSRHEVEVKKQGDAPDTRSLKERLADNGGEEQPDSDPADDFEMPVMERSGGDKLSFYLAFVPTDVHNIGQTTFESYVVNDSNYYIRYAYMVAEGANWTLRATGEVEPNTKEFVEEFGRDSLNKLANTAVQLMAYKREKPFMLKPAIDVRFRIDPVKFYKLNTFAANDFFDDGALLYAIVENDVPMRQTVVDAQKLKAELYGAAPDSPSAKERKPQPARTGTPAEARKQLVPRYDRQQSKSRPVAQKLKDDKIIVDLHASELLDTTAGMSAGDILEYQLDVFRRTLEQYKDRKGQKLVFIHGKGEGVLRQSIIHELNYKFKQYPYQDASFREYGYGATQVTIK